MTFIVARRLGSLEITNNVHEFARATDLDIAIGLQWNIEETNEKYLPSLIAKLEPLVKEILKTENSLLKQDKDAFNMKRVYTTKGKKILKKINDALDWYEDKCCERFTCISNGFERRVVEV